MCRAIFVCITLIFPGLIFGQTVEGKKGATNDASFKAVFPGAQPNGAILLPNQWSLQPAGKQVELGDFPVNMALHPGGHWLAVLHGGYGTQEIVTINLKTQKVASRVTLAQTFYGLCFSPNGKSVFASGGEYEVVHGYEFEDGLLSKHRELRVVPATQKFIPGGMTASPSGETLYVAGTWGDALCVLPLNSADATGKRLFVSLWNKAAVAVVDLVTKTVVATLPTESHPTEMVLAPGGKTLFVACANSTNVSVIDTVEGKALETIVCSLYPTAPSGNTPNSLTLTLDGQLLLVANADANNLAVINVATPGQAKPLGFIPVGWYPTSVRYNPTDKKIYVANSKGTTPKANPKGPNPGVPGNKTIREYIAGLFRGTLGIIDLPSPERLAAFTKEAYTCSPLRADQGVVVEPSAKSPIPKKIGEASPIKHCIYIIKENRTYDQVFGDMLKGKGDPYLCIFPEKVTPNHHKLANEFVLLDNFYVDGEVSADGHQWSMAAYATDYVEKVWPLTYRSGSLKKLPEYASEGDFDSMERPAGGYIWDRCADAKVSYRSYGEWIENGKTLKDPGKATVKALEGHFDPWFRGFDMDYPDQKRADRFIEELARFEKEGAMPQLIILRLPNDHTAGTRAGKPTPTAYLADNDLALGRVVEALSKSKFWRDSAIFVVEDDAQNGCDHVDAHRTVALVISPHVRRGHVDSQLYSTSSMLRTMELILGLKPMSQFDAAARPMYESFQGEANLSPYQHVVPGVDMNEKNTRTAWGAKQSETFDLTKEDAADDMLLNEVIWRSVRGRNTPMPAPVRAAFVVPHVKKD